MAVCALGMPPVLTKTRKSSWRVVAYRLASLTDCASIHAAKPDDKLITLRYLEVLPKLAEGTANKIFLPYEASGIIAGLAAMVEGIGLNGGDKQKTPAAEK